MKSKLISDSASTELYPNISFPVVVNGRKTTATIFGLGHHPLYYQYMVHFSDGFEDMFTLVEDEAEPATIKGKKYAQAINEDLQMLNALTPDEAVWLLHFPINEELANVWVREKTDKNELSYKVYYNGDYRFSVFVEDYKWVCKSVRKIDPEAVNEELAAEVIKLLDKESLLTN